MTADWEFSLFFFGLIYRVGVGLTCVGLLGLLALILRDAVRRQLW